MTWNPPAPEPCGPDCTCHTEAHPTGHAAQSIGDHDRRQRELDTELSRLRPCRCATSEHPAQCHCLPDTPSGRLPWTDRLPETPAYQTGRVATERQPEQPPAPTMDDLNEAAPVLKAGGEALDNLVNPPRPRERWWRRILGSST